MSQFLFIHLRHPNLLKLYSIFKNKGVAIFSLIMMFASGILGGATSPYFSLPAALIGTQFFFVPTLFFPIFSKIQLDLDRAVRLFIKAVHLSFVFFILDTLISLTGRQVFMVDLGVYRFSPSLGPSAGAIYLMTVFITLLGLPRLYTRIVHYVFVVLVFLLIIMTATRIALIALLLTFLHFNGKKIFSLKGGYARIAVRWSVFIVLLSIVAQTLISRIFFEGAGLGLGAVNTNGRMLIWLAMLQQLSDNYVFGYGWGASYIFLTTTEVGSGFGVQPHSDFVRLLFEAGSFGFVFFGLSIISIWRLLGDRIVDQLSYHYVKTAKAFVLVFLVFMSTDNVFIYHFYLYPSVIFICIVLTGRRSDEKT